VSAIRRTVDRGAFGAAVGGRTEHELCRRESARGIDSVGGRRYAHRMSKTHDHVIRLGQYTDEEGGELLLDLKKAVHMMMQSNSGGGKSNAISLLCERASGKIQIIVLDWEGEFSSLREKYPFVIAGKGGDVPARPDSAALLARRALEHRFDLVNDLSEMTRHEKILFSERFLNALDQAPKELWHPVIVIVDEGHELAPEKGQSEAKYATAAMASRGRKRGYILVVATQRLAKLSKDVAAELQNNLIGLCVKDVDRKRAAEELGFTEKKDILALRDLEAGEFHVFGPALNPRRVRKAKLDKAETFRPARERLRHRMPAAPAKVKEVLGKLVDLPKEAADEARDVATLTMRVRDLEREVKAARAEKSPPPPAPKLDEKALKALAGRARANFAKEAEGIVRCALKVFKTSIETDLKNFSHAVETDLSAKVRALTDEVPTVPAARPIAARVAPARAAHHPPAHPPQRAAAENGADSEQLGACPRAVLKFLAARQGKHFSRSQIGAWINYSMKSSLFESSMAKLVKLDLVGREHGKYFVDSARIDRVLSILGSDYEEPPRNLYEWLPKFKPTPAAFLKEFLDNPDHVFTRQELSERTGRSITSSGFENGVAELRSLGFIRREHDGSLRLNPDLVGI
jgi:hypothetical protein